MNNDLLLDAVRETDLLGPHDGPGQASHVHALPEPQPHHEAVLHPAHPHTDVSHMAPTTPRFAVGTASGSMQAQALPVLAAHLSRALSAVLVVARCAL